MTGHLRPDRDPGLTGPHRRRLAAAQMPMAYACSTVLLVLYSLLLLVLACFGLGMCRVAARGSESDALEIEEWLATAKLADEGTADAQSSLGGETRIRSAAGGES